MIQLPRRSVTRFFIPLIDVMTLLFCIFLLMPLVKPAVEGAESQTTGNLSAQERQDLERLRAEKEQWQDVQRLTEKKQELMKQVDQLRQEKIDTLKQRLYIRVLEIKRDKLFLDDLEITAQNVGGTIEKLEKEARDEKKNLYFLILYPRRTAGFSGFPTVVQEKQYDQWFKDVAHSYDRPSAGS
jgi:hypothetical protein